MSKCFNETSRDQKLYVQEVLSISSCIVSILGAAIIYATFIALPEIRNFTRKLIVCLTTADLLTAVGYLLKITVEMVKPNNPYTWLCEFQSFLTTFSSLVSFFLTISVAVHILLKTVLERKTDRLLFYNGISWGLPLIILGVATAMGVLGQSDIAGPWCWIKRDANDIVMWMFVTGKAWELLTYIVTFLSFFFMKFYLYRQMSREMLDVAFVQEDRNFMYVWLVLYILRLPGTLKFLLVIPTRNTCNEDLIQVVNVLSYMQAIGDPSQAFGNAILFCIMDKTVRARVSSWLVGENMSEERRSLLDLSNPEQYFNPSELEET